MAARARSSTATSRGKSASCIATDFFKQNRVSWDRVKQGFVDREALYGFSVRNLNAFCQLAGAAADRETTKTLLARIGDAWDADVWKDRKYFDGYRKWAGLS